jgi:hypothetical protein
MNRASVVVESSLLSSFGVDGRLSAGSEAATGSSPGWAFMMCRPSPASRGLPGEVIIDVAAAPVEVSIDSCGAFGAGVSCNDDAEDSQLNLLFSLGTAAGWLTKLSGGFGWTGSAGVVPGALG